MNDNRNTIRCENSSRIRKQGITVAVCLLLSFFMLISFSPLSMAAEVSTFAGGEIDGHGQSFSFLGVDLTSRINKTVAVSGRIIPNYLTYTYYSGDKEIKAYSPGIFAVAGIKLFWDQTMFGVFGGGEFRDTTLHPDDTNSSIRGNTSAGLIQGEFDSWLPSKTNLNAFASYSGTNNFLYEKARIKQQITNLDFKKEYSFLVGLEQFIGRNADFQENGFGLAVELYNIPLKISVALRSGFKHDSTFGNGIYWGLDLYKGF